MEIPYSAFDLLLCLLLYSFLGWGVETCCFAIKDRRFVNRGFLNLPLALPYGITAVILLQVLPTLNGYVLLQFVMSWVIFCLVWKLSDQFVSGISRKHAAKKPAEELVSVRAGLLVSLAIGLAYMLVYLIIHPVLFGLVLLLPDLLVKIVVISAAVLVALDFFSVMYTLRTNTPLKRSQAAKEGTQRLGNRITENVWRRLQRAYPGITEPKASPEGCVFARGICFDKLVWVFLVSSFLGALIEMVFCRITGDRWMNRSSVLYGSFSFVWGFGAVVLTVTLQHLTGKAGWKVFLAGFVIGGAYEYFCSVFTELVFGTVFWDYSEMPLNIGGRTNVLYCVFWGLLAVVWLKLLYPVMSRGIEKLPVLLGKVATWIIVFIMICNGLLTAAAMIRYTQRQTDPTADSVIETFLDSRYDDKWMENRWPNMLVTDPE